MIKTSLRPVLWGLGIALYLRFGLEPTGWLFYELSHATGLNGLYWGYSVFRGAGYAFNLWSHQLLACIVAGGLVGLFIQWRAGKRGSQ